MIHIKNNGNGTTLFSFIDESGTGKKFIQLNQRGLKKLVDAMFQVPHCRCEILDKVMDEELDELRCEAMMRKVSRSNNLKEQMVLMLANEGFDPVIIREEFVMTL